MVSFDSYNEERFLSWLSRLLRPDRFDLIITVERKATAVIRTLLDISPATGCEWDWDRVLSSDAIPYLPAGQLNGKRILVFNEMIHRGRSTKAAINVIKENSPGALNQIYTAAFIVHEDFERLGSWRTEEFRGDPEALSPDFAIQRRVSDGLYRIVQESLIESLRNRGALLLDTEHLESTFSYTIPHRRFLDALATFGKPTEYEQEGYGVFPGVTVDSPVVANIEKVRAALPEGSDLDAQGPRKIRLVRRGSKHFAFIPIWYPPIPFRDLSSMPTWKVPSYLKRSFESCPPKRVPELMFYLASLVAGVELIRSIWSGLAPYVGKGVEPEFPAGSEKACSPLGHLRALYPLLDFAELEEAIKSAISAYKDLATSKRVHLEAGWISATGKRVGGISTTVEADFALEKCRQLLVGIISKRGRHTFAEDWFEDSEEDEKYPPFTWSDFWEVGEELRIPPPTRSIVMDIAIDNAILKPTHKLVTRGTQTFIVRAYEPDSEFADRALEKIAHGAEVLFA